MLISILLTIFSTVSAVTFGVLYFDLIHRYKKLHEKNKSLCKTNLESCLIITEKSKILQDTEDRRNKILIDANESKNRLMSSTMEELEKLQHSKNDLERQVAKLQKDIENQENDLKPLRIEKEMSEIAFYQPYYSFETSLEFERSINKNRREQKDLLTNAFEEQNIAEKNIVNALKKLALRAFNSESELYEKIVDYKNVVQLENRLNSAYDSINKIIEKFGLKLKDSLLKLKLSSLRLTYELQEKKQAKKEEQQRIKEIMRDEIKAEREMEKAKADAEKEMANYSRLLERAVEQAERANGEELNKLNAQISLLQQQLEDAKEKERKISQAQQTKSGYVYVISNIGSFGENVYKIGMTRRLEPQERVDELGDASVPFPFDVHAMIWHENAPELENNLHKLFESSRVNKVNPRKEFYKVDLKAIETAARDVKADIEFIQYPEAKEYRMGLNA